MTEPWVAHARRRWRTGRRHVAGGHACPRRSTRTPMWGATWQWGVGIWRAHGLVGPSKKFGAVTEMRYRAPIFILTIFIYFFRVGRCPTHVLPFAGDVDARRVSDSFRTAEIAWTRVHTIVNQSTCVIRS